MIREWFESAAANTVRFVARWVWRFSPSILWVTVVLVLLSNLGRGVLPTVLLVALLAVSVTSFLWSPLHGWRPFVGDWRRLQRARANRRARLAGYRHAVGMRLTPALSDDDYEWAMRRPVKRLPSARFLVMPEWVKLTVAQTQAATTDELVKRAEAYAPVVGAPADFVTVRRETDSVVRIIWRRTAPVDKLAAVVPFEPTLYTVPDSVVIGRSGKGEPFKLNLWDNQTLGLGSSGSGKGSLVWSVMLALAPAIQSGTVKVYGIDLKGSVELMVGARLFASIAGTYEEAAATIAALRVEVDERLAVMVAKGERKHTPTVESPAVLLLADEFASLVYSAPDNKAKAAVEQDLKRVLSVGRACRVNTYALAQDPRADSILARSLFTQSLGLRFRDADSARLALGATVVDAGAACHLIPQNQQGTGYAISESGEVERFRAYWCSDEVIREYAARYGTEKATAPEGDEVQA